MDVKLAGEIISKFKPDSMIISRTGEILWTSKRLEALLSLKSYDKKNIHSIINIESNDILSNNIMKLNIGNESYNIIKILLKNLDDIILVFDLVGDYSDSVTKSFILEEIIDNLYDGVLLSDKEGKVVIYNHAMEELEERNSKEMLGEYIWDAYGYSDKNKSEHMQVFDSGKPIVNKYKANGLREMMLKHNWPGNIRELEHFIENIMVRTNNDDRYLRVSNIPTYILDVMLVNTQDYHEKVGNNQTLQEKLDIMEKKFILKTLDNNLWNVSKSAEELGVTRQSMIYRMRKLTIERK